MSINVFIFKCLVALLFNVKNTQISGNECGTVEFIDPKIIRGTQTVKGAWPFLVALYRVEDAKFFCGATLISAKNVLSAAHCVRQKYSTSVLTPEDVAVLLGVYNIDLKVERGTQQRDVEKIYVHPDWKVFNEKYDADLAIFVLRETVDFTKYIRPICMPEDDPPVDAQAAIVGWGLSENTTEGQRQSIPVQGFTTILNDTYCYTTQRYIALFSSTRTFCGGGDGASPNKGDSGGGLFVLSDSAWIQYGIVSASLSDAKGVVLPNSGSIYTDVIAFRRWIDEIVVMSGSDVMTKSQKTNEKVEISCNYEIVLDTIYKCSAWGINVTDENSEADLVTRGHIAGYSEHNVTEIWFWTGTLEYVPHGIGRVFPNLHKFWVGYDDRNLALKILKRSNFKDMEHLWYLDVRFNSIERVDEDTLRDLPNLRDFIINNNKLQTLQRNTFRKNPALKHVNANSNQLQFLHEDLFIHNRMLEEALFKNNKLKMISIDFTQSKSIKKIDFGENICIDKALDDVSNVAEFHSLLLVQCNGMSERNIFI